MKLSEYIKSLSDDERAAYAARCGTTSSYLEGHIYYARREPRKKLREALAKESFGQVSVSEVWQHFAEKDQSAA